MSNIENGYSCIINTKISLWGPIDLKAETNKKKNEREKGEWGLQERERNGWKSWKKSIGTEEQL